MGHRPRRNPPGRLDSHWASAFADGRRLRDATERRQRSRPPHPLVWRGPHPIVLVPIVLFGMAVVGMAGVVLVWLTAVLTMLLLGAAGIVVARGVRRVMDRPAAPPRRSSSEASWSKARRRFTALRADYARYECDPMEVLRLPALADVTVPSTERFVEAFAEAQALETDTLPPADHIEAFVAAVERAERAWRAARDAAERIRHSRLSPGERSTVDRVVKLLTTARETDNDAERYAAYARARSELARLDRSGIVHVPRLARDALDAAARGALPA